MADSVTETTAAVGKAAETVGKLAETVIETPETVTNAPEPERTGPEAEQTPENTEQTTDSLNSAAVAILPSLANCPEVLNLPPAACIVLFLSSFLAFHFDKGGNMLAGFGFEPCRRFLRGGP